MPLTDAKIRSLRPKDKQFKQSDEKGLFLLIKPTGSKLWQHKIRFGGKEKVLSYGAYPEVGFPYHASATLDEALRMIETDPVLQPHI